MRQPSGCRVDCLDAEEQRQPDLNMHLEASIARGLQCFRTAPSLTFPRLVSPTVKYRMQQQQQQQYLVAAVCSLKPGWAGLVREDAEVTLGGSTPSGQVAVGSRVLSHPGTQARLAHSFLRVQVRSRPSQPDGQDGQTAPDERRREAAPGQHADHPCSPKIREARLAPACLFQVVDMFSNQASFNVTTMGEERQPGDRCRLGRLQIAMWHLVSRATGPATATAGASDPLRPWWFVISGHGWTSC